MNKEYILCNMNGEFWSNYWGWSQYVGCAKKFSKGAVIAFMKQLKKMGIECYYDTFI